MKIEPGKPSMMPLVVRCLRLRPSPPRRVLLAVTGALVTAALSSCSATMPRSPDAGTIARELAALGEEDQRFRDVERIERMTPEQRAEFMRQAEAADRRHAARLEEIVTAHGWPDATRFGERAARAAFLIVQHADHDVGFQERMLPLLQHAAANGNINPTEYAYLVDRVAVARGRPQEYGTQYEVVTDEGGAAVVDEQGRLRYLAPLVVHPERLDARRAEVGLGPWADYERRMAEIQEREEFDGPRAAPGAENIDEPEDTANALAARPEVPPPFEADGTVLHTEVLHSADG